MPCFAGTEFDPSEETEVFRLSASDYGTGVIVPRLMTLLAQQAPKITIEVVPGHTRSNGWIATKWT